MFIFIFDLYCDVLGETINLIIFITARHFHHVNWMKLVRVSYFFLDQNKAFIPSIAHRLQFHTMSYSTIQPSTSATHTSSTVRKRENLISFLPFHKKFKMNFIKKIKTLIGGKSLHIFRPPQSSELISWDFNEN